MSTVESMLAGTEAQPSSGGISSRICDPGSRDPGREEGEERGVPRTQHLRRLPRSGPGQGICMMLGMRASLGPLRGPARQGPACARPSSPLLLTLAGTTVWLELTSRRSSSPYEPHGPP